MIRLERAEIEKKIILLAKGLMASIRTNLGTSVNYNN